MMMTMKVSDNCRCSHADEHLNRLRVIGRAGILTIRVLFSKRSAWRSV